MVRSPARSLRLQFSERYTGQRTVVLPIAGQGSNRPLGSCSPRPPVATTARRAGLARALDFGASWTCHGRHPPNGPLLAGASSPADRRGPSACCRSATGRRVLGADPSKRPSARRPPRLAGEPAHRSATRPGRHRTPPHTRARCAVPATAPGLLAHRHPRTTARGNVRRHHRYPVAPHRHRTGSTRNSLALTVSGAHSHTRTTPPQHQPAQPRHRGAAVATATIEITAGQLDPAAVGDLPILLNYEMQS